MDSASAGVFNRTAAALDNISKADLGSVSGGLVRVSPRVTGDLTVVRLNRAANATVASTDGVGLFHASRLLAASYKAFKNGIETASFAGTTSTGIPNDNVTLLREATLYSNHQLAAAFVGGGLSDQESADVYTPILAYLQAVGAA